MAIELQKRHFSLAFNFATTGPDVVAWSLETPHNVGCQVPSVALLKDSKTGAVANPFPLRSERPFAIHVRRLYGALWPSGPTFLCTNIEQNCLLYNVLYVL